MLAGMSKTNVLFTNIICFEFSNFIIIQGIFSVTHHVGCHYMML